MEKFEVELGAMTSAPIFEKHQRGENWMAVILPDPHSPGGLKREFVEQGKGKYFYIVKNLQPGLAVEFGADYYTGGGKRQARRKYGVITSISEDFIEFEWFDDAAKAIQRAEEMQKLEPENKEPEKLEKKVTFKAGYFEEHGKFVLKVKDLPERFDESFAINYLLFVNFHPYDYNRWYDLSIELKIG